MENRTGARLPAEAFRIRKRVYDTLTREQMIPGGSTVFAGLSGGADSVCLLRMLAAYREMHPFSLTAVHIHHGIRGEEAEEDARFCEALARELQLPFLRADCDVPKEAAAGGISLEEAGRLARYRVFGELLAGEGGENARVALAHHMDDAAETLLLNLLRGSGPLGAASMRAVRGPYIRPLLVLTRQEIETYLALTGAPFRTDSTNLADDAARNRLRHHVLPYLQAELNGRSAQHLAAFAEKQEALADFFCAEAEKRQGRYLEEREDGILVRDQLFAEELPAMRTFLLREAMAKVSGSGRDLGGVHVEAAAGLFRKGRGKRLSLPGGLTAVRIRGGVLLQKTEDAGERKNGDHARSGAGSEKDIRNS